MQSMNSEVNLLHDVIIDVHIIRNSMHIQGLNVDSLSESIKLAIGCGLDFLSLYVTT